jgi:hypothetical protein
LVEAFTTLKKQNQFLKQATYLMRTWTITCDLVTSHCDGDIRKGLFNPTKIFVSWPEQFGHEMGARHYDRDGGGNS